MQKLEIRNICKSFPGVKALDNVSIEVKAGEILGLLGENGAGKSTLGKILNGIYLPDTGEIRIDEKDIEIKNPNEAKKHGIAMIHQELSLMRNMNVMENIMLGFEPVNSMGIVDFSSEYETSKKVLDILGGGIDPHEKVENLSMGDQQRVEIARAISQNARIFIMDEPTSSLMVSEIDKLFQVIDSLKKNGAIVIYVTHKLDEVFRICNKITVLRNGKLVGTVIPEEVDMNKIVSMVAGRSLKRFSPHEFYSEKPPVLKVRNLTTKGLIGTRIKDINFELRSGEILGITGLLGAGKTELSRALWGIEPLESAPEIYINEKKVNITSANIAFRHGFAYVPEDRRLHGIVPNMDVAKNITFPDLNKFCSWCSMIDFKKEEKVCHYWIDNFKIATSSFRQLVKELSGGNQQKVVLCKWLETNPKILMIDEPTRGIDVGAKSEILKRIQRLAEEGMAVLIFSSEIDEVLSVANNILVLWKGQIIDRYKSSEAEKDKVLASAMGVEHNKQEDKILNEKHN